MTATPAPVITPAIRGRAELALTRLTDLRNRYGRPLTDYDRHIIAGTVLIAVERYGLDVSGRVLVAMRAARRLDTLSGVTPNTDADLARIIDAVVYPLTHPR